MTTHNNYTEDQGLHLLGSLLIYFHITDFKIRPSANLFPDFEHSSATTLNPLMFTVAREYQNDNE